MMVITVMNIKRQKKRRTKKKDKMRKKNTIV